MLCESATFFSLFALLLLISSGPNHSINSINSINTHTSNTQCMKIKINTRWCDTRAKETVPAASAKTRKRQEVEAGGRLELQFNIFDKDYFAVDFALASFPIIILFCHVECAASTTNESNISIFCCNNTKFACSFYTSHSTFFRFFFSIRMLCLMDCDVALYVHAFRLCSLVLFSILPLLTSRFPFPLFQLWSITALPSLNRMLFICLTRHIHSRVPLPISFLIC